MYWRYITVKVRTRCDCDVIAMMMVTVIVIMLTAEQRPATSLFLRLNKIRF